MLTVLKLLHAADLHLDSPLRGLARYEGAPEGEIRGATRGALENLVQLALDEQVGAVLLAGDIYDGDWNDYNTGLFFRRQMSRLGEADIKVYLVSGNHDAASNISRQLSLPQNVHVFSQHEPETAEAPDLGIAVHGQGYAKRDILDNLAINYPAPRSGLFNIGLLHTALDGDGSVHLKYAPCSKTQLVDHGYDYWALGHVHTREVVADEPWIVFPGNLQGRYATETGPKGATLITVDDARLRVLSVEHHTLDTVRWEHLEIDAREVGAVNELDELVRNAMLDARSSAGDDRLLAVRISVVGPSAVHEDLWRNRAQFTAEMRGLANDEFSQRVWVEKVRPATSALGRSGSGSGLDTGISRTSAASPEGADGSDQTDPVDLAGLLDTAADLRRVADALRQDPEQLAELLASAPLVDKLPHDVRGPEQLPLSDPDWQRNLFDNAVDQLLALLDDQARQA
ncbi:MAG TPA: DNA repair exonuclease [Actinocrinis sp.]|nr:DNA repair exonuclease [Actinocrinis sp.]